MKTRGIATKPSRKKRAPTPVSTPSQQPSTGFASYDDKNYGYLRILADPEQLRIEYHPASDFPKPRRLTIRRRLSYRTEL